MLRGKPDPPLGSRHIVVTRVLTCVSFTCALLMPFRLRDPRNNPSAPRSCLLVRLMCLLIGVVLSAHAMSIGVSSRVAKMFGRLTVRRV